MWEVLIFQIAHSATSFWGYGAYTSKNSFYFIIERRKKLLPALNYVLLQEGNKPSENCTGAVQGKDFKQSKQQHYKTEIYGKTRLFQEIFHSSRCDNYTKPQASQKHIFCIKFSSAHVLAGIPQELRRPIPASAKHKWNLVSGRERGCE